MEDVFEIRLNQKGIRYLRRLAWLVPFLFLLSVLVGLSDLANVFVNYTYYHRLVPTMPEFMQLRIYVSAAYMIFYSLVFPLQVYLLYRFIRKASFSLKYSSTEAFNDSFAWLMRHVLVSFVLFLINLIFMVYNAWVEQKVAQLYV